MAAPVITIHNAAGTEIPDGTPLALPVATAGTPTAETVISIRNNAAAGPAVDPATNRILSILGRRAGTSDDPTADGLAFLVSRALEVRVSAVSGGATAAITGYRPQGAGRTLSLGTIPDGGIVTLGVRCRAGLAASLVDVEIYLSVDGLQTTPLPDGTFEALGNFVYGGRPGAGADADFSEIYSITGALAPDSPNDDSVDIWSEIIYALAGVWYTFAPGTAEIVFTATDGDAATLLAGEAYYAAITLDGTNTPNVTKGSKDTTPLTDADKPTPPAGEFLVGWVVVPFGLVITTVDDVADLDFFGYQGASGLDVTIGAGRGAVGGRWWYSQTPTTITLADDDTSTIYVVPSGGFEAVVSGSSPTDSQSMAVWSITTASGAVTVTVDRRQIGPGRYAQITDPVAGLLGVGPGFTPAAPPEAPLHVLLGGAPFAPFAETVALFQNNGAAGDSCYFSLVSGSNGNCQFTAGDSGGQFQFRLLYDNVNDRLRVYVNGVEVIRVLSNGNVGIADTNPVEKLAVTGNITASGSVTAGTTATVGGATFYGKLAAPPSSPAAGGWYYDTALNQMGYWNTSIWVYW